MSAALIQSAGKPARVHAVYFRYLPVRRPDPLRHVQDARAVHGGAGRWVFHLGTGFWLMYLVSAAALNFVLKYTLPL